MVPDTSPPVDRITDPDKERMALRLMWQSLDEVQKRLDWASNFSVAAKSSLEADDRLTNPFNTSHYVQHQIVVALQTLISLRRLLVQEETEQSLSIATSAYGPYALLRNSLDCSTMALWLLQPSNRSERIRRRLRAQINEAFRSTQARRSFGDEQADERFRSNMKRISEVSEAAGLGPANELAKLPETTQMIGSLESHGSASDLPALGTWQICSGLAHGKSWASLAINDLEMVTHDSTRKQGVARVTISYVALGLFTQHAALMALRACDLLERQGTNLRR